MFCDCFLGDDRSTGRHGFCGLPVKPSTIFSSYVLVDTHISFQKSRCHAVKQLFQNPENIFQSTLKVETIPQAYSELIGQMRKIDKKLYS